MQIDWDALRPAAVHAASLGYCPYSELRIGAAALCADGRMVTGCNVENAARCAPVTRAAA
ncbi:MAG: hypothetical protein ACRDTA_03860 [Pseudonocardiaceae bacterium]